MVHAVLQFGSPTGGATAEVARLGLRQATGSCPAKGCSWSCPSKSFSLSSRGRLALVPAPRRGRVSGGSAKAGRAWHERVTWAGKDIATSAPRVGRPERRAGSAFGVESFGAHDGQAAKLKMGGNAWAYLVDAVAGEVGQGADAARYYASAGTPPGRFLGRRLDGLGISPGSVKEGDLVSPEMLHRMLAQLADPLTGQPLGRLCVGKRSSVAGFDMTFSPPKSRAARGSPRKSGLGGHRLGRGPRLPHAHRRPGRRQEPVCGVVASSWLHYESRLGDPQLHHYLLT
jgi:hypothetical protein